jgi:predicted transposase/invertase (TIGR01784 family)
VWFPQVPADHLRFPIWEPSHQLALTEDLEFHVFELPKFTKSADALRSGLEIWLYFLPHAEKMDTEALPQALRGPLVARAIEELTMVSQTELERARYEARRKAQLDQNTWLKAAHQEGLTEGRQSGLKEGRTQGEWIGAIHLCERLLNRPETPTTELEGLPLVELAIIAAELEHDVSNGK